MNVLVIGTGTYQISGIKKLQELGYYVYGVDGNQDSIGKNYVNEFICIDVTKYNDIITYFEKNAITVAFAIAFATEIALRSVAQFNNYFSLPGLQPADVAIANSKAEQRRIQKSNNLNYPAYYTFSTIQELENKHIDFSKQYIMKPIDNSGSRGVSIVSDLDTVKEKFSETIKASPFDSEIILEEFIPGIEFTVESFVYNQQVFTLAISEKKKPINNFTVSTELLYNSPFVQQKQQEIKAEVNTFLKHCNFSNNIIHTEVIYSYIDHKFYIIETSTRSGGFKIFDRVLPLATGVDTISLAINLATGKEISLPEIENNPVILGFFFSSKGLIQHIDIDNSMLDTIPQKEYDLFVKPKDEAHELSTDGARLGYYITHGNLWKEVYTNAQLIQYAIHFEIV